MKKNTRLAFTGYMNQIATLNGVSSATKAFTVEPSVQQTLETKMQESSSFLTKINIELVEEKSGEKLGLSSGGTTASNTDTSAKDRETTEIGNVDKKGYECRKNNFDTHIRYNLLDKWAKFKDFQKRLRDHLLKAQALDRIRIGFNGTSYAATSDRAANPKLQDVNIGWLQKYRNDAPENVMDGGATPGTIKVYEGGDYENLDAVVMDAVDSLIDVWHQEDPDLVVLLGRGLMADKYFPLVNKVQDPSEMLATDLVISQKRIGGLPAVKVPFMPAGTMLIIPFDNLSIYVQEGARRRNVEEVSKRDRIENYESSNDDYVVEDYGRGCLIENIDTTKP
jgi:P2 family phage major capsid protein